jgi:hypothetical protein
MSEKTISCYCPFWAETFVYFVFKKWEIENITSALYSGIHIPPYPSNRGLASMSGLKKEIQSVYLISATRKRIEKQAVLNANTLIKANSKKGEKRSESKDNIRHLTTASCC